MFRILLAALLLALPAKAGDEQVVAGLSQNRIAITANFDGSEILIFGAVKRNSPPPKGAPMEVVITVAGPSQPVTVRRKDKRLGIWVNVDAVELDSAPSFYAVATTGPMEKVLNPEEDRKYRISIRHEISAAAADAEVPDVDAFTEALIRIRTEKGLYQLKPGSVQLSEETLFRTSIKLPSNLTEGEYTTRIYLTRDGQVVDEYETTIDVSKVGLERWLFKLSREKPLYYGLLSLFIAIVAGWGASAFFNYFRS